MAQADVIIVGAGVAGLTAAYQLVTQGINVLVIESRNRIGGRVWTANHLGVPLDLGAGWLYAMPHNPLISLAEQWKLRTNDISLKERYYYINDTTLPVKNLYDYYRAIAERLHEQKAPSFQQRLHAAMKQLRVPLELYPYLTIIFEGDVGQRYGAAPLQLSGQAPDEVVERVRFYQHGFGVLPKMLARRVPILLNETVKHIDYEQQPIVTTNLSRYEAQAVIVTVPLGVLKRGAIEFRPELPSAKQAAIEQLQVGLQNKVYLQFPRVFWPEATPIWQMMNEEGEHVTWINLYALAKKPILLALYTGAGAFKMERQTQQQTVATLMSELRRTFGNKIPSPSKTIVTHWLRDEHSLGTHAYLPVGGTADLIVNLAGAVNNRLFFAGEATSAKHIATVHGAFLSGMQAARDVQKKFRV